MKDEEKKELITNSTNIVLSAAGALVGFAIGGPVGALAGGVLPPTLKLANKVAESWYNRRKARLTCIVDNALKCSGKNADDVLNDMLVCPEWCDNFMSMIRQIADGDPELDVFFTELMASVIKAENETERNRLLVLYNSIKDLNKVQVHILVSIKKAGGTLAASEIAKQVQIPELELRNAVRDLELRGMIEDNGEEPTVWTLRELGYALAKMVISMEENYEQ